MFLTNKQPLLFVEKAVPMILVWGKKGAFKVANLAREFKTDRGKKRLLMNTYCGKLYYQNNLKMKLLNKLAIW